MFRLGGEQPALSDQLSLSDATVSQAPEITAPLGDENAQEFENCRYEHQQQWGGTRGLAVWVRGIT